MQSFLRYKLSNRVGVGVYKAEEHRKNVACCIFALNHHVWKNNELLSVCTEHVQGPLPTGKA